MDRSHQLGLLERIDAHRAAGRGTDTAAAPVRLPVSRYTSPDHLANERAMLASTPTIAGLSALVPAPSSYATVEIGGRSVILTRGEPTATAPQGSVSAMLNVCRHRGAEITSGCGHASVLQCPYHGWTYRLDGTAAARRRPEHFGDLPLDDLVALPVLERDGLIWVNADPAGSIPDQPLHGAEVELGPLALGDHRLFATTRFTRSLNWKLAIDTFCEAYHVPVLHRETLAPMIYGDFALFDAFGPHGRMVTTRTAIDELDVDSEPQPLLRYATVLWFLLPNTVLIHQQDHVQLYQSQPGATPDEATMTVSLYVPNSSTRSETHWARNFDLLVDVTDNEDFTTAAGIQRGYHSGAQSHVVFGANEPALQHVHDSLEGLLP